VVDGGYRIYIYKKKKKKKKKNSYSWFIYSVDYSWLVVVSYHPVFIFNPKNRME